LPYPQQGKYGVHKMMMQSVRVPLSELPASGIDIDDIREITLLFDQTIVGTAFVQGTLYSDEVQLTR
jgi:hypothetical protein